MPARTEGRVRYRLEETLRAVRLAGRTGMNINTLARREHLGVARMRVILGALDEAGLVDLGSGGYRVAARPPNGMPEDVQFEAALRIYRQASREGQARRR